jgi:hypothetical protein
VSQFNARSFTEFILSEAEGFRMTTPIECHSERSEESLLPRFAESSRWPTQKSHDSFCVALTTTKPGRRGYSYLTN